MRYVKKELLTAIVYNIREIVRQSSELIRKSLNKSTILSKRQDRSLQNGAQNNVVALECVELPNSVINLISFVPKQQVRDRFIELQFLTVEDRLVGKLRYITF